MDRKPLVGDHVIYCDSRSVDHNAVVTAAWSATCINVVFASSDEAKTDSYGRQIERETSLLHAATTGQAHGRYWRFPEDPRNQYKPPEQI